MTYEAQASDSQPNSTDPKPIIEIQFEKYIPDQNQLDRFVEIIHSNSKFLLFLKKHLDSQIKPENITPNSVPKEDLDELDHEIEEMLKQMEKEERTKRDAIYI